MEKIEKKFIEKKSELGNTIAFKIKHNGKYYGNYLEYNTIEERKKRMKILAIMRRDLIVNLKYLDEVKDSNE